MTTDFDALLPRLVFGLAPTLGQRLDLHPESIAPLRLYLEQQVRVPVQFVEPPSYEETLQRLRSGDLDAAMVGELAGRQAEAEGGIELLVAPTGGDDATYRSVFITRIDSGIHDLSGLVGHRVGFVDPHSTSGYLVPRLMLREAGISPEADVTTVLLGTHRSVAEAVIAGKVIAGALHELHTRPISLEQGADYARLRRIARSRPIPLGPIVVRSSIHPELRARLVEAMLRMHELSPEIAGRLLRDGLRYTVATPKSNPTLKSIAALAGVSYVTVSRVINQSGYVSEETAARVQAIVREVGYVPNGNARMLKGQHSPLIAYLTTEEAAISSASRPVLARNLLRQAGLPMVICQIVAGDSLDPVFDLVRDRRFGAIIVDTETASIPLLQKLALQGVIIAAFGVSPSPAGMIGVTSSTLVRTLQRALRIDSQ